jgi:hypothetical protein
VTRRQILKAVALVVVGFSLVTTFSVTRYVLAHPNEPLQQNVASWARNKGMGAIVDQLEVWLHDEPPAVAPVDTLALAPLDTDSPQVSTTLPLEGAITTTTQIPENTAPAVRRPVKATQSCPAPTNVVTTTLAPGVTTTTSTTTTTTTSSTLPGETTTTTTTTTTIPARPVDVEAIIFPGIKGEGAWRAVAKVRKEPMIYATSIRPLWCYGSVVATMATYDPTKVRAALFNGTEVPGGKGWKNTSSIRGSAVRSLIASFNGGFRFEHNPGGYITEGRTIRKMRKGYATFGIRPDGTSTIGIWGEDMTANEEWASLRQNLPPLVAENKSVYASYKAVNWGQDFDNKVYSYRSALCIRLDGLMMFIAVGKVNIGMLADTLVFLGCRTAMQLDINGTWPFFSTYSDFGKTDRSGRTIDTRMGDPNRHLNGATKDFIGLFDPQTLKPGALK